MNEFDERAREWDNNPVHWERSEAIAGLLIKTIPLETGMRALEFGAGTGILSFLLASHFSEIVLMDSSREMVNVMIEKVDHAGLKHMEPVFSDLERSDYTGHSFDCIYTQMTMHHIADTGEMVRKFYQMLLPGGWLAIADLYSEDGSFHGEGFHGHNGFDTEELKNILQRKGFFQIKTQYCFTVKKMISEKLREFPLFLMTAQKPVGKQ